MQGMLRIAVVLGVLGLAGPAHSQGAKEPCGKNHYILDEPCIPAWDAANAADRTPDFSARIRAGLPVPSPRAER